MTASVSEQQLAALRAAAHKAAAHPLLPREARDAIALMVAVIGDLSTQIDWLRRDLASAVSGGPIAKSASSPH